MNAILKMVFSVLFYWLVSSDLLMIMLFNECHMQQAITWANVDSVPCRLMESLGHNELKLLSHLPEAYEFILGLVLHISIAQLG